MNLVNGMRKKSVEEMHFEASLQQMISRSFGFQSKQIENDRHAYLTTVAQIVVNILDFRVSHPKYRVPKNFTWEVCKYKKKHGYCWSEDRHKKAPSCGFPHSYALQRAALYVIRTFCKFGDKCADKEMCRFHHPDPEDVVIAGIIEKIFRDRISAPPRPRKNKSVQSIRPKAIARVAQPSFSNLVPLENRYSELINEEIDESTSSPEDADESSVDELPTNCSTTSELAVLSQEEDALDVDKQILALNGQKDEDEEVILFVPKFLRTADLVSSQAEVHQEEVPEIAANIYASIFGRKNGDDAFPTLDHSPIGPAGIVDENDEILPFVPRSLPVAVPLEPAALSTTKPPSLINGNGDLPELIPFFDGVNDDATFDELGPATEDSPLPTHEGLSAANGLNPYPPLIFVEMFVTSTP